MWSASNRGCLCCEFFIFFKLKENECLSQVVILRDGAKRIGETARWEEQKMRKLCLERKIFFFGSYVLKILSFFGQMANSEKILSF